MSNTNDNERRRDLPSVGKDLGGGGVSAHNLQREKFLECVRARASCFFCAFDLRCTSAIPSPPLRPFIKFVVVVLLLPPHHATGSDPGRRPEARRRDRAARGGRGEGREMSASASASKRAGNQLAIGFIRGARRQTARMVRLLFLSAGYR